MYRLFRLCLWQILFISIGTFSCPSLALEEEGIRIRGPKSSDAFPYDRYGPIQSTDTLWTISLRVRPDSSLTVYQVMQALYQKNPQAFKNNNLNYLVNGSYLIIPSFDEISAVDRVTSKQKSQTDDDIWQSKDGIKIGDTNQKPKEQVVKKQDLDIIKSEINDQIKDVSVYQTEQLTTIQNDLLDSIDGVKAILKDNQQENKQILSVEEKLATMEQNVPTRDEVNQKFEQVTALLEQAALEKKLEKEQAIAEKMLAKQDNLQLLDKGWFIVLMTAVPSLLCIGLLLFFYSTRIIARK
jgi:pilus assembly protein FimV